jgi:hypothetical protein
MKVYPVPGGRVRDPRTRAIIPADGYDVPDSDFYWLRRLAHGDVTKEPPIPPVESVGPASDPVPSTAAEETHQ